MISNGFYTSVDRFANSLLYRGYDDEGKKILKRVKYQPKLFLPSKKNNTDWKALDGTPVEPISFNSMSEVRTFEKTYNSVDDFQLYGNTRHVPAFIQSVFPNEIRYSRKMVDTASLDIETSYGDGFPDVHNPTNQILTIAYKSSKDKTYRVWGIKGYDESKSQLDLRCLHSVLGKSREHSGHHHRLEYSTFRYSLHGCPNAFSSGRGQNKSPFSLEEDRSKRDRHSGKRSHYL